MAINLKDPLQELQRKVKRKSGARMRQDEITKHAVAVAALLLDERGLSPGEARRVLTRAISLLCWEKPDVQPENPRGLIPPIYKATKNAGTYMTTCVNQILERALFEASEEGNKQTGKEEKNHDVERA